MKKSIDHQVCTYHRKCAHITYVHTFVFDTPTQKDIQVPVLTTPIIPGNPFAELPTMEHFLHKRSAAVTIIPLWVQKMIPGRMAPSQESKTKTCMTQVCFRVGNHHNHVQ